MTTTVYQSWLADRGICSPGSQPFNSIASDVSLESTTLILASARNGDLESLAAVSRLAGALRATTSSVSWIVVEDTLGLPSVMILRTVLPMLTNLINLTDLAVPPAGASFPTDERTLASRPLRSLHGPAMSLMIADGDVKKRFWRQLQAWISLVN